MPEIPDLEAIAGFLAPRLAGNPVATVEARVPWLVRTGADALPTLVGHAFTGIRRHGKFLLFATDDARLLVVNPMLTGRFHWAAPAERRRPLTGLVLAPTDAAPTGDDKTSLACTTHHDRPGSLVELLGVFASRGINLTRIESRPTRRALGTYVFLLDLQGHHAVEPVAGAIAAAREVTLWLRVLGSYPRWTGPRA